MVEGQQQRRRLRRKRTKPECVKFLVASGCNTVTVHTIAVQDDQLRSADDKKEALAHAR